MARKWYCSECVKSFDRRHDLVRQDGRGHLDRFHSGQGQAVRLDQLPEDLRNLAIVGNSHEDSFPGQAHTDHREVRERIGTFSAPRPHNNTNGKSPHSGDNNMSRKYYNAVGSGGYRPPNNNAPSYERFVEKFWARWQDTTINHILRERVSMQPQILSIDPASFGDVFGYISHVCDRCHMWEPLEVYFTESTNNTSEQRGHVCYDKGLAMSVNTIVPKNVDTSGLLKDGGISLLSGFVRKKWGRADGTIMMTALKATIIFNQKVAKERIKEDEGEPKINKNTLRLICTLPHPKKPKEQQAVFSCDLEKECKFLTRPEDSSHWINRLLSDNSNAATADMRSEELTDFLTIAKGSTFVFVKILGDYPFCCYLIALWDNNLFSKAIKEEKLPSNLAVKNDIQKNDVAVPNILTGNGFCLNCGKEAHLLFCQSCRRH